MNKKRRKKKALKFGDLGFAMKVEACNTDGDVLLVSKKLWVEIAEILMEAEEKVAFIEKEIDSIVFK